MSMEIDRAMAMQVTERPREIRHWLSNLHDKYWRFVSPTDARTISPRVEVISEGGSTWYAVSIERHLSEIRWPQKCVHCGREATGEYIAEKHWDMLEGLPLAPQLPPAPYRSRCGFTTQAYPAQQKQFKLQEMQEKKQTSALNGEKSLACGLILSLLTLWHYYANIYILASSPFTDVGEMVRMWLVAAIPFAFGYIVSLDHLERWSNIVRISSRDRNRDKETKIRVRRQDTLSVKWNSAHPKRFLFLNESYAIEFYQLNSTKH